MDWNKTMKGQQGQEAPRPKFERRDVVVEVLGFPRLTTPEEAGIVHVKEVETGREMYVAIAEAAKSLKKPDAVMQGNIIDDRMKVFFEIGDTVVCESLFDSPGAGESIENPVFARYFSGLPIDESKVVQGIMTVEGSAQACFAVQVWGRAFTMEGLAQVEEFDANLDYYLRSQHAKAETGKPLPIREIPGVQFRIIDSNNQLVGMSPLLKDHSLNPDVAPEDKYRPLSTAEVVQEFIDFEKFAQAKFPGCRVDAAKFDNFKASPYMTWNHPESPQAYMCRAKGKLMSTDDKGPQFGGRVSASAGILKLSPGKIDLRRGQIKGAENRYATELWCSGRHAHVHSMIADPDGTQLTIHPSMGLYVPKKKADMTAAPVENQEPETSPEPLTQQFDNETDLLLEQMGEENLQSQQKPRMSM